MPEDHHTPANRSGRDDIPRAELASSTGTSWFLGIGIDAYTGFTPLHNAVRDVEAVASVLKTLYGFEQQILLTDDDADGDAIDHKFDELATKLGSDDRLVIYYAGHGKLDQHNMGFWVPADADPKRKRSLIRNSAIRDYIKAIKCRHILLLSDSCFAGSLFRGLDDGVSRKHQPDIERLLSKQGRWVIASGGVEDEAYDGPKEGHSPFAQSVLDALQEERTHPLTTDVLLAEVRRNTTELSKSEQVPDGGNLLGAGDKGGQLVFVRQEMHTSDKVKVAELEEELLQKDQLLAAKKWKLARRAFRLIEMEASEDVKADHLRAAILEKVELRLDFIRDFPKYKGFYQLLEQEHLDKLAEQKSEADELKNALSEMQATYTQSEKALAALEKELAKAEKGQKKSDQQIAKLKKELAEARAELEELRAREESQPKINDSSASKSPDSMVFIPGGTFQMGDQFDEGSSNEKPVHSVRVNDFYLGRTAVTFTEYDLFCEATGRKKTSSVGWGRGQRPVINVTWYDAVAYCNWCSEQEGRQQVYSGSEENIRADFSANGYRLPTEAEWEYAAREGGRKVRFGNGKNMLRANEVNFDASLRYKKYYSETGTYRLKTVAVGSLNSPNNLGLHDMSGNVWEWCWDWYDSGYYSNSPEDNPKGPGTGSPRVRRGGSWLNAPEGCRAAFRSRITPRNSGNDLGFRLARSVE